MATWVIGDIHGCWQTLQLLLERIGWDPVADELWLVGDLVNRGPESLRVLRWTVANDESIVAVLGNHDLHLLARAAGVADLRDDDRFNEVLEARDRDQLLDWLRRRPLLHRRDGDVLVHAGLWPGWSLDEATRLAADAQRLLGGPGWRELMARLAAKPKPGWRQGLAGGERVAAATAIFTRLRVVRPDGRPKLGYTGPPEDAPAGCRPWFESSEVVRSGNRVVFGHWAMLGFHRGDGVVCLDSGCVYGGSLTALRLDDGGVAQEPVADPVPEWEGD